jgi:hypothetical protein
LDSVLVEVPSSDLDEIISAISNHCVLNAIPFGQVPDIHAKRLEGKKEYKLMKVTKNYKMHESLEPRLNVIVERDLQA